MGINITTEGFGHPRDCGGSVSALPNEVCSLSKRVPITNRRPPLLDALPPTIVQLGLNSLERRQHVVQKCVRV